MAFEWKALATKQDFENVQSTILGIKQSKEYTYSNTESGGVWLRLFKVNDPTQLANSIIRLYTYGTTEDNVEIPLSISLFTVGIGTAGSTDAIIDISPISYSSIRSSHRKYSILKETTRIDDANIITLGSDAGIFYSHGIMAIRVEVTSNRDVYIQGFCFLPEINNIYKSIRIKSEKIFSDNIDLLDDIEVFDRDGSSSMMPLLNGTTIYGRDSDRSSFITARDTISAFANQDRDGNTGTVNIKLTGSSYPSLEIITYRGGDDEEVYNFSVNYSGMHGNYLNADFDDEYNFAIDYISLEPTMTVRDIKNSMRRTIDVDMGTTSSGEKITAYADLKIITINQMIEEKDSNNNSNRLNLQEKNDDDTVGVSGKYVIGIDSIIEITVQIPNMDLTFTTDNISQNSSTSFFISDSDASTLYAPVLLFSPYSAIIAGGK